MLPIVRYHLNSESAFFILYEATSVCNILDNECIFTKVVKIVEKVFFV
jgi:hypothetical protein